MKILQLHNLYIYKGGEDTVVELEKNLLTEHGHSVFQLKRENKGEIKNFVDKFSVAKNLSYSNYSKELVDKEIKKFRPNVVHVHNFFPLWTASIFDACIDNNIPTVLTLHNYRTICANGLFFRKNKVCEKCLNHSSYYSVLYGCYQNSRFKSIPVAKMITNNQKKNVWKTKINRFIVFTNFAKNKYIQANFPKSKIRVKPNYNPTQILSTKINEELKKNCIYVGRISEEKGITTLLKAWKNINFPLKIFGDGPLKHLVQKNQSNITFLGHQPKNIIIEEMKFAKFLIFPSECYEGFPMTILESFASSLLVLASNIGSVGEIVKDKHNGILFEPGSITDLGEKINWILTNPEECKKIKQNALNEFSLKYSKERNYELLIKIYKEAMEDQSKKNN